MSYARSILSYVPILSYLVGSSSEPEPKPAAALPPSTLPKPGQSGEAKQPAAAVLQQSRPLNALNAKLIRDTEVMEGWVELFEKYVKDIKKTLPSTPRKIPASKVAKSSDSVIADSKKAVPSQTPPDMFSFKLKEYIWPNQSLLKMLHETSVAIAEDSKKLIDGNNSFSSSDSITPGLFQPLRPVSPRGNREVKMAEAAKGIARKQRDMLTQFHKTVAESLESEEFIIKLIPVPQQRTMEVIELAAIQHFQPSIDSLRDELDKSLCEFEKADDRIKNYLKGERELGDIPVLSDAPEMVLPNSIPSPRR